MLKQHANDYARDNRANFRPGAFSFLINHGCTDSQPFPRYLLDGLMAGPMALADNQESDVLLTRPPFKKENSFFVLFCFFFCFWHADKSNHHPVKGQGIRVHLDR